MYVPRTLELGCDTSMDSTAQKQLNEMWDFALKDAGGIPEFVDVVDIPGFSGSNDGLSCGNTLLDSHYVLPPAGDPLGQLPLVLPVQVDDYDLIPVVPKGAALAEAENFVDVGSLYVPVDAKALYCDETIDAPKDPGGSVASECGSPISQSTCPETAPATPNTPPSQSLKKKASPRKKPALKGIPRKTPRKRESASKAVPLTRYAVATCVGINAAIRVMNSENGKGPVATMFEAPAYKCVTSDGGKVVTFSV